MLSREDKESGFSLVELLVVIVIIGILSAIAVGAFLNQRQKANDAALKSDVRSAANTIVSWSVDKDQDDFVAGKGHGFGYIVEGENADHDFEPGRATWNDIEGFPTIHMSDGNMLEVIMVHTDGHSAWTRKHDEGEFCLAGTARNSSYDYVPGSGDIYGYEKYLFFDVAAGGLKTMEELMEIRQNGQEISCEGSVGAYMKAIGAGS